MNPQTSHEQPAANNPLSVMQPGEQVVCEIKRHPFGILTIYLAEGLLLIVLAVLFMIIVPNQLAADNHGQAMALGGLVFFILTALSLAFVYIASVVYWGNKWIVTSDSITQVIQTSLFHKQSSQLSLGNLEDVTSEQNGILPSLMHFGTIKAETAGEKSKFVFAYCPNPNYYAQKILSAREVFEQTKKPNEHQTAREAYTQSTQNTASPAKPQLNSTAHQQPGYGAPPAYVPPLAPETPEYPPSDDSSGHPGGTSSNVGF